MCLASSLPRPGVRLRGARWLKMQMPTHRAARGTHKNMQNCTRWATKKAMMLCARDAPVRHCDSYVRREAKRHSTVSFQFPVLHMQMSRSDAAAHHPRARGAYTYRWEWASASVITRNGVHTNRCSTRKNLNDKTAAAACAYWDAKIGKFEFGVKYARACCIHYTVHNTHSARGLRIYALQVTRAETVARVIYFLFLELEKSVPIVV